MIPTLVSSPASLTLPMTPTTALSLSNVSVTAGSFRSISRALSNLITARRQRAHVDLEPDRQRGCRAHCLERIVHPQDIRPQLFVTERVITEDGLAILYGAALAQAQTLTCMSA